MRNHLTVSSWKALFVLVLVSVVLPASATAQLIAYESFAGLPLGTGVPGTGSGSFGWASAWQGAGTTSARFQIVDPTPNMSYQIAGGVLLDGKNRALQITTAPEPIAGSVMMTRDLPAIPGTFYISFLVRMPTLGSGTDGIDFHVMTGATAVVRYGFEPGVTSGQVRSLGPDASGSSSVVGGIPIDATSHLILVEVALTSTPNIYTIREETDPPVVTTFSGGLNGYTGPFQRLGISVRSTDAAGPTSTVLIDEIRVGYRRADVLPPFAPALAPKLEIEAADKLRWPTETGKTYQVQYSHDMVTWYNLGAPVIGNGQIQEKYDRSEPDAKRTYRIEVR